MLKTECTNPRILSGLSACGHGDKILLVDGNYPLASKSGDAEKIYLGVSRGLPTVPQVLKAINSVCPIEKIEAMVPEDGRFSEPLRECIEILKEVEVSPVGRWEFYDMACKKDVRVAISTGEGRTYACLLLTVGVS